MKTKKVINLISGGGTTNAEVLKAEKKGGGLWGFSETVAIISSDPEAEGIKKAINLGFPQNKIYIADSSTGDLAMRLNEIFNFFKPDYFHQLGWMPFTPIKKLNGFIGLNQHLGPGGKYMYGPRRIYAHQLFCEWTGQNMPIEIFCQMVGEEYDIGDIIEAELIEIDLQGDPKKISGKILPVEHYIQIRGRKAMAINNPERRKPYAYDDTPRRAKLIKKAKIAARDKYPPG